MTRFLFAAAGLSLAFALPAAAENVRTFTHENITYTYTSTKVDDTIVIEGTAAPVGGKFRFLVRDGREQGELLLTPIADGATLPPGALVVTLSGS